MNKMGQISKEAYKKCEVEIIDKGRYFWINRRDLEVESDYDNSVQIFDKCDSEKQKYRHELMPNTKFQPCRRFVRNDLVEKKIKSCRKASEKFFKFKEKSGLDPYKITCDERDIISALRVAFESEIIRTQYCIKNRRLDAYLPKYKLGIEADEYDHEYRDPNYKESRQLMIEGYGITVIRTNPEAPNCINRLINQIYMHIIKWTKKQTEKSTKKSLINDFSKRLLGLEFICCCKNTARLQRMKNAQLKIKPIKTRKEIGTTYCLGCKDYTHNFKPQEVKMTNKVLREKSN